jgi:hypothetical protein
MKRNMGIADRLIRIGLAASVAVLYFTRQLSPTAGIILGILGAIFLVTGLVGFCPLYLPLRLSTRQRKSA